MAEKKISLAALLAQPGVGGATSPVEVDRPTLIAPICAVEEAGLVEAKPAALSRRLRRFAFDTGKARHASA